MFISFVRTLVVPPYCGWVCVGVCVWNIWTDVKLLLVNLIPSTAQRRRWFEIVISGLIIPTYLQSISISGYGTWLTQEPPGRVYHLLHLISTRLSQSEITVSIISTIAYTVFGHNTILWFWCLGRADCFFLSFWSWSSLSIFIHKHRNVHRRGLLRPATLIWLQFEGILFPSDHFNDPVVV